MRRPPSYITPYSFSMTHERAMLPIIHQTENPCLGCNGSLTSPSTLTPTTYLYVQWSSKRRMAAALVWFTNECDDAHTYDDMNCCVNKEEWTNETKKTELRRIRSGPASWYLVGHAGHAVQALEKEASGIIQVRSVASLSDSDTALNDGSCTTTTFCTAETNATATKIHWNCEISFSLRESENNERVP